MITVAPSGLIIYQSDDLTICTNPPSLPSQISTFRQVLNFCSAAKAEVTWKTGSKFHKPYLGCMHVRVHRTGMEFYLFVQICFPACMPSHLFTVVSKGRTLQNNGKSWSLPCFRKSLHTCVRVCGAFTKIRPFRSDLEYVCMDRLLCLCSTLARHMPAPSQLHLESWRAALAWLCAQANINCLSEGLISSSKAPGGEL